MNKIYVREGVWVGTWRLFGKAGKLGLKHIHDIGQVTTPPPAPYFNKLVEI